MLDLLTNIVKEKHWPALGRCTAAMRWLEKYYCFQGVRFTHFNPISGSVPTGYPKEARNYFMRCAGFGKRSGGIPQCHCVSFDGFSVDAIGRMYAFRGNWYYRLDTKQDGWHPWRINSSWPSLHGKINGVFTWDKKIYFIQGSQLFVYRTEAQYVLIEGYPKPVQDELGINGSQVDATFMCQQSSILYVVMGKLTCVWSVLSLYFHPLKIELPSLYCLLSFFLPKCITSHLSTLKPICHMSAHSTILCMSACSWLQSSSLFTTLPNFVSSANLPNAQVQIINIY
uniref:Hemopexin-like n=1 Tax=Callorhinchus milii TaxID=7868 RepID=A0A4W3GIY9_CALMI